jgi:hypothetical protein
MRSNIPDGSRRQSTDFANEYQGSPPAEREQLSLFALEPPHHRSAALLDLSLVYAELAGDANATDSLRKRLEARYTVVTLEAQTSTPLLWDRLHSAGRNGDVSRAAETLRLGP